MKQQSLPTLSCLQATAADIEAVFRIRRASALDLKKRFGKGHWATFPKRQRLLDTIEEKSVYIVFRPGVFVATFRLSEKPPSFFDPKNFSDSQARAAYLTGLAVDPACQRQGIGSYCLRRAEEIALNLKCSAIRFDVYDSPAGAAGFYEACGFSCRCKATFKGEPLLMFEKVLS